MGTNLYEREEIIAWSDIANEVNRCIEEKTNTGEFDVLSDQERYDMELDMIFKVFSEHYPECARELGLL